ncbi:MAG: 3-deoxy-D-manno-octulosonic acid kinase [Vibrionaceae bacterium]
MQDQGCNEQFWFDGALLSGTPLTDCFDIEYWQKQQAVLGLSRGRGVTWFVQTQTVPAVLRHYRRGGLFGKMVQDSYFFTGFSRTRVAKEFALLQYLREKGLPVPRPIAARAQRCGAFYRADILLEKIPFAHDLVSVLKGAPLERAVYQQIGQVIRKLHDASVCHTDLNIHNILLDSRGQCWLIDFDKCGVRKGQSWKLNNLARLKRSFVKECAREAIFWQPSDWQALLAGYNEKNV